MEENRQWKGNTGGGTLGQRLLILFFRFFNLRIGYAVMAMVVPFYMIFSRKGYLAIYQYFRQHFDFSKWKSFRKTYRNHFLFGQVILDRFAVFAGQKKTFKIEIDGNEHFRRLVEDPKGFVIVGSHVGNFEIAGYLLNAEEKRINAIIFGGETATVQKNRSKVLNDNSINLVPVSADMSHLFVANAALTNGEIVCMPADRVFGSSKSVECEFLKGKANFPVGAFALAASADVEVLAVFCLKIAAKKYKIFVRPINARHFNARHFNACHCGLDPQSPENKGDSDFSDFHQNQNNRKQQISNCVKSYISELEDIVKRYPEQWFNYYKFWK